ncbi:hypothetical protein QN372_20205 [Undibacterium sp. RTI2.1]|uniref:hypothetical protein n=1 Tax=unclassified Undibacterium TaxID=2630295 RepID=UPI002B22A948|nr:MULTISPECIES: hypothetical protein [unclassified Undibacterium]MEB0033072.1 hypothetical protein [Undibacterium sp. RTI2.1]MEB0118932.1 hypothetical protein [Undibacterium sp. RTI2.2]
MKVTFSAAAHTNSVLDKIEQTAKAFTTTPELFRPEFWEFIAKRASNSKYAQDVLNELYQLASAGVTIDSFISSNLVQVMQIARTTLRTAEINKICG